MSSIESSPTLRDLIQASVERSVSVELSSLCDDQGGQHPKNFEVKPDQKQQQQQQQEEESVTFRNQLQASLAETEENDEQNNRQTNRDVTPSVISSKNNNHTLEDLFGYDNKTAKRDKEKGYNITTVGGMSPLTADLLELRTRRRSARLGQSTSTQIFPTSRPKIYPLSNGDPYYLPQVIPEEPAFTPEAEPRKVEINEISEVLPNAPPPSPVTPHSYSANYHHPNLANTSTGGSTVPGYGMPMYGYAHHPSPAPAPPPPPPPVAGYYPYPMYGMPPAYSYPPPSMMPYYPPIWHHLPLHHQPQPQPQHLQSYNTGCITHPHQQSYQPKLTQATNPKDRHGSSKKTVYRQSTHAQSGDKAAADKTTTRVRLAQRRESELNKMLKEFNSLDIGN